MKAQAAPVVAADAHAALGLFEDSVDLREPILSLHTQPTLNLIDTQSYAAKTTNLHSLRVERAVAIARLKAEQNLEGLDVLKREN